MKVACVLITHLPVKAERRRRPELRLKPVIVTESHGSDQRVLDASPEAVGVGGGMSLQEALSRQKKAALVQADISYYEEVFDKIVELLMQRSPVVEKAGLGCAYVGLDGLEAMYGGEARLVASLQRATPDDFNARIGLAYGKFPAYVAAAMSREGETRRVPDDTAGFLKRLPVDLLPISWEQKTRLHGFGLHTMGQLAALPLGPVQAQFGPEGKLSWELVNGIDGSPLRPYAYVETVVEHLTFPSPASTGHSLLLALDVLLSRAFAQPEMRGRFARATEMEGRVLYKPPWVRTFAFKEPVNSKESAYFALKGLTDNLSLPGAIEDLKLTLSGLTGESGIQTALFSDVRKRLQLRETMRRLESRLRTSPPIYKVKEIEPWSRIPERRRALVQFEP